MKNVQPLLLFFTGDGCYSLSSFYKIQVLNCALSRLSNILSIYQQLFLMIIKDIRSMEELLIGVGTFTNTISSFDTQGPKFITMNKLKSVSAIFIILSLFLPNDRPSIYDKCFLFHLKSSFRCQDTPFFVIFPLPFHNFKIQKGKWKWNDS